MGKNEDTSFAVQRQTGNIEQTKCWKLHLPGDGTSLRDLDEDRAAITEAADLLRKGGTVAFPTETVYGLGADARSSEAVEAVFAAKGRPSDNPLIVHIANRNALAELVSEIHPTAEALMEAYWPGPLTLVLPVRPGVLSPRVTAGLDTVGVRIPDHPIAISLLREAGCPVAAPSANRSGRPSPTLAAHVMEDLNGFIGGVLDGGAAGVGLESTVVQVQPDGTVAVLRPGGITAEQLAAVVGADAVDTAPAREAESAGHIVEPAARMNESASHAAKFTGDVTEIAGRASESAIRVVYPVGHAAESAASASESAGRTDVSTAHVVESATHSAESAASAADSHSAAPRTGGAAQTSGPAPRAPGMKYTHYAPHGWLGVVRGSSPQAVAKTAADLLQSAQRDGGITGLLLFEEHAILYPDSPADCVVSLGSIASPEEGARSLYAALRRFDEAGATYILAEACPEAGLGAAIMNRLMKAAGGSVIEAE